jgi:dihydrofolate reductase
MANIVYIACSLDGYIADKNGGIEWLSEIPNPDKSDFGFSEFLERIDAIIMGRNTFETVLSFGEWPYTKKVFVLSNTIQSVPDHLHDKAEIIAGDLKNILSDIYKKGFQDLYIDGGNVIQNFLKEDLIDELIITRIPILLGGGTPLFGELKKPQKYIHIKTEVINDCIIKSSYVKS